MMREHDLYQDITSQLSKLPAEQAEKVQQYIDELCGSDLQREEQQNKYLTFWCCGQTFGVNIDQVVQILQIPQITPLPDSPPYMKGVISLRGEMVPVIDLRVRLGKEQAEYTDRSCIVIMNIQDRFFGAVVDCVCDVETITPEQICPPPQKDGGKANYLSGIVKCEAAILLIDAEYLFTAHDLEQILDVSLENPQPV